ASPGNPARREARAIARKMLANGLEPGLIASVTGITPEELSTLSH
ncbi:Putative transposase, partial [Salmonella enterica subsp. enterica serovar Mississippi str. A4-633]